MTLGPDGQILPAPCIPIEYDSIFTCTVCDDDTYKGTIVYWLDAGIEPYYATRCIIDWWMTPDWT